MSMSKEKLPGTAAELPRRPKCTRCRHHGIIVPQKGHMKLCPFLRCACPRCLLITERTRITALQRNLKRAEENKSQIKEKRSCVQTGDGATRPAAQGTGSTAASNGGACFLAAFPLSEVTGAPESAGIIQPSPLDLRCGPAAGGELVSGSDSRDVLTFRAPYLGPSAALPFIPFPFRMSGHYSSSYAPCPDFVLNLPLLPPVPAGLYNQGLHGPLMIPHFQQGAVLFPPPPEPPVDCKQVFFTLQPPRLPEVTQKDLMSTQQPQPPATKHADQDIVELD